MGVQKRRIVLAGVAGVILLTSVQVFHAPEVRAVDLPPGTINANYLPDGRTQITWDPASTWFTPGTTQWFVYVSGGLGCLNATPPYRNVVIENSCFVNGLAPGQTVSISVDTWKPSYSAGGWSWKTPVVVLTQVPTAPVLTAATAGNATASVSWNPPSNASAAGGNITYTVQATPGGVACTTKETTCDITGLTNEQPYTFSVTATGPAGVGPAAVSGAVVPQASVPGQPRAVKARRSGRTVTVTWQEPKSDGGSVITEYVVTAEPGGTKCKGLQPLRCTISSLKIGASYTFSVEARNIKGSGKAVASTKVTIPVPPPPPPPPKKSVSIS